MKNEATDVQPEQKTKRPEVDLPAAGQHAEPELVDPDKVPGSGTLLDDDQDVEGSTG